MRAATGNQGRGIGIRDFGVWVKKRVRLRRLFEQETVGLLVEENALRLVGVTGDRVVRWGSAPLPPGVLVRSQVRQPDALCQAAQALFDAHNAPRNRVILGITGIGTASRLLPLPSDSDLPDSETIRDTVARLVPTDDSHLAWQAVEQNGQRAVYVLITPQVSLDTHLDALAAADIAPVAVDLKPLALVRAVGQRNAVVADLEHTLLTLAIVDGAIPQSVRVLPLDFPSVSKAEDKVIRLIDELQRLIDQRNREVTGRDDGRAGTRIHAAMPIWISGTLANHALLRAAIRDGLEHPCTVAPAPLDCPPELPVAQYLACLGLVMKRV